MSKYSYDDVTKIFQDAGCKLISIMYIKCTELLNYKCSCGSQNIHKVSLSSFKKGTRCPECKKTRRKKTDLDRDSEKQKKYTFEQVYKYFEDEGCLLLENEYVNSTHLMNYSCNCGSENVHQVSFAAFKNSGTRCPECRKARRKETMMTWQKYGVHTFDECDMPEYHEYVDTSNLFATIPITGKWMMCSAILLATNGDHCE